MNSHGGPNRWDRFKRRFSTAWAVFRHIAAVRGLLQWMGLWQYAVAAPAILLTILFAIWTFILGLPIPVVCLIALGSFVLPLAMGAFVAVFIRIGTIPADGVDEGTSMQNGNVALSDSAEGRWPNLELGKRQAANGLLVWLQNNAAETVPRCTLFLGELHLFSEKERDFLSPTGLRAGGSYVGVWLIKSQSLGPHARTESGYLVQSNINCTFLSTRDATDQRPQVYITDPGIFRARINVITSPEEPRQEELFFEWAVGAMPRFVRDPRKSF